MESIRIEATRITPRVHFDPTQGIIEFSGISAPENSVGFYHGILATLDKLPTVASGCITANISFVYFNTSSSKCLFDVFKRLLTVHKAGKSVTVNWFYAENDDDMREVGEDYAQILNLNFNFIQLSA